MNTIPVTLGKTICLDVQARKKIKLSEVGWILVTFDPFPFELDGNQRKSLLDVGEQIRIGLLRAQQVRMGGCVESLKTIQGNHNASTSDSMVLTQKGNVE